MSAWTKFTLEVVTPLFSGDDPQDKTSPIRVPSIRGALRFWFRALAAGHGVEDLTELAKQESELFGNTNRPSPIRLRVNDGPTARRDEWSWWVPKPKNSAFNGVHYLLGQGLWNHRDGLTRPHVPPRTEFTLEVRFTGNERLDSRFLLTMWTWLYYGGLGARTRRGFGQLRCTNVESTLNHPILGMIAKRPSIDFYRKLMRDPVPPKLREGTGLGATKAESPASPLPKFPMLAPYGWKGAVLDPDPYDDLEPVLHEAGRRWRNYRASQDIDHIPGKNTRSPEWIDVIHGNESEYPIAALGLPINYFSKKSQSSIYKNTIDVKFGLDNEPGRRVSPVWIRPTPLKIGPKESDPTSWYLTTHIFYSELLPPGARLEPKKKLSQTPAIPDETLAKTQWDRWLKNERRR
ncbi:type III-B CRISPR module RAMP protein Cmr1 [Saccharopolyspora flava]|uniref:CRISPR type III-B/RAMP module RAMP protein Cmr1 n=1 Tax=Saccharopolyspora flava TaxID=95161 RepID=A0A1I6UK97_9PSEU|nr:type III-B CRISPR module RAMP protein Cmr1 [Saccharopolyspora flava]SFT01707.1 CRISPR type III-B/RAMP module RAMP protein Cmr1 [Saccharopolyspora flava]